MTSDLYLDKHVANVCAACFYWLRQPRRVRRSLDTESAATLVTLLWLRVDYCDAVLVGASRSTTDDLQRVMTAPRAHQSTVRRAALAGRSQRVILLTDYYIRTLDIAHRQHLRSAGCRQLFVPQHRRSMFGRRVFSVAGPAAWNSLPDYLRDPTRSLDSFRRNLKTFLFSFH